MESSGTPKKHKRKNNRKRNVIHLLADASPQVLKNFFSDFKHKYYFYNNQFEFNCMPCFSHGIKSWDDFLKHINLSEHIFRMSSKGENFTLFCGFCRSITVTENGNSALIHVDLHKANDYNYKTLNRIHTSTFSNGHASVPLHINNLKERKSNLNKSRSVGTQTSIENLRRKTEELTCNASFNHKPVNFSETYFQLTHPGMQSDCTMTKEFTIENIEGYVAGTFYDIYFDIRKLHYKCILCSNVKIPQHEFYKHLKGKNHNKKQENADLCVKICDICQLFLLGTFSELKQHFLSADHTTNIRRRMKLIQQQYSLGYPKLGWSGKLNFRSKEMFKSIDTLRKTIELSLTEAKAEESKSFTYHRILQQDIKNTLVKKFPDVKIQFAGSRVYGLAKCESDIDVYVDIGNGSIEDLNAEFIKAHKKFRIERIVADARVPILTVEHIPKNIICDINCSNSAGQHCSDLIRAYIALDPRVPWMIVAVREWASANLIRGTGKFTSYGLTWLVLFFLMTDRLIPPVTLLKSLYKGNKKWIDGSNYSFSGDLEKIKACHNSQEKCKKSYYELLSHFFRYYADLDLKKSVLFPFTGTLMSIGEFAFTVAAYKDECIVPLMKVSGQFILMDPFCLTENLLRNVDQNLADHFKLICNETFRSLQDLQSKLPNIKLEPKEVN